MLSKAREPRQSSPSDRPSTAVHTVCVASHTHPEALAARSCRLQLQTCGIPTYLPCSYSFDRLSAICLPRPAGRNAAMEVEVEVYDDSRVLRSRQFGYYFSAFAAGPDTMLATFWAPALLIVAGADQICTGGGPFAEGRTCTYTDDFNVTREWHAWTFCQCCRMADDPRLRCAAFAHAPLGMRRSSHVPPPHAAASHRLHTYTPCTPISAGLHRVARARWRELYGSRRIRSRHLPFPIGGPTVRRRVPGVLSCDRLHVRRATLGERRAPRCPSLAACPERVCTTGTHSSVETWRLVSALASHTAVIARATPATMPTSVAREGSGLAR